MQISRAIVSTNDNPLYYEFWPIAAKAWKNIDIEPCVAAVGNINLGHAIGTIIKIPLIEGVPSAFISQVIRFIIPCLFPEEISVIGDIDMIPLSKKYFTENIEVYSDDNVIIFSSDAYKGVLRYPMCYIAAKGKYFQQIIGLKGIDSKSITDFIKFLFSLNKQWDTDELFFAEQLHQSGYLHKVIFLRRGWTPTAKRRIDRAKWRYSNFGLITNRYIDAHSLRPLHENVTKLAKITSYVYTGSNGKVYLRYLIKKKIRLLIDFFLLLKQNHLGKLFEIDCILGQDVSKRKIIAFSLYGNNPLYLKNLQKVIKSYQNIYPDWKCRVYIAKDIDTKYINLLLAEQCEVYIMHGGLVDARYMCWRFLAVQDSNAEVVIIRDLDSVASEREKQMVEQWLKSNKSYHIIRDHVTHNNPIMGGMWGVKKNIDLKKMIKKFLFKNSYGADQVFLAKYVYPIIKEDLMVHDSYPRMPAEQPIVMTLAKNEGFVGEVFENNNVRSPDVINQINLYYKKQIIIN